MVNGLGHILRHLHRRTPATGEPTDAQLLQRYVQERDEAAFEALLRRHAALVFGVCRRILRDVNATEDAFQATFLLLVRKANSIRRLDALACWLYGVAYRVAVRAKANEKRRRAVEGQAAAAKETPRADGCVWEFRALLDQELNCLPEKYRRPLILCYLEGKTNEEAAQQLGWRSGTLKGRLARARDMLRSRLQRRGLWLSAAALAVVLSEEATAAAPAELTAATLRAIVLSMTGSTAAGAFSANAVALTEGVMRAMFWKKVIVGVALLLAVFLSIGVSVGGYRAWAGKPSAAVRPVAAETASAPAPIPKGGPVTFVKDEPALREPKAKPAEVMVFGAVLFDRGQPHSSVAGEISGSGTVSMYPNWMVDTVELYAVNPKGGPGLSGWCQYDATKKTWHGVCRVLPGGEYNVFVRVKFVHINMVQLVDSPTVSVKVAAP